ncbi:MAG: hypothetical protein ACRD12_18200 [Acidimicrobiales bacterium]
MGRDQMDLSVIAYLLYLVVAVPLTVWVGLALRRHGEVFLVDVFRGDTALAHAVNQLLVIGFYLLNLGYVLLFMRSSQEIDTGRALMEQVATKVGGAALVVGLVHFFNVWVLNSYRRRALRAHAAPPPYTPPPGYYAPAPGA